MIKKELRKLYLEKRAALSDAERRGRSARISDAFFRRFDLTRVEVLHTFLPIERFGEIDTRLILSKIEDDFPRITMVAPRVDAASGELVHLRLAPETVLLKNAWQIEEPAGDDFVAPAAVDLVLVPLLCFDRQGFRVGYGKGFYDKFLEKCRADCLKIGLGFFPPEEKIDDTNDFDVRLDCCVTPEEIFFFN